MLSRGGADIVDAQQIGAPVDGENTACQRAFHPFRRGKIAEHLANKALA